MTNLELINLIKETFGHYKKPKKVTGFPREPWMDRLEKIPLGQLSVKDIDHAVLHVFPRHYGDKNVFCYLLNRILIHVIKDTYEWTKISTKLFIGERCVQWKSQFLAQEIDVIAKVYQYASCREYYFSQQISSYYFTFFLLWYKDIEIVFNYFSKNYSEQAVDDLKYNIHHIINYYQHIPDMLPLAAILGVYYSQEPIILTEDDRKKMPPYDDIKNNWFENSIHILEIHVQNYFSPNEINILDRKIKELFIDN